MKDLAVHQRRLLFCSQLALRSPDPSTKVGAMVFSASGFSVGHGWNSFPKRMKVDPSYYQNRELKYDRVIHGEMRALHHAGDQGSCGSLYTNVVPCKDCAKHICDGDILKVYFFTSAMKSEWVQRFASNVQVSMTLFAECGVEVIEVPDV